MSTTDFVADLCGLYPNWGGDYEIRGAYSPCMTEVSCSERFTELITRRPT